MIDGKHQKFVDYTREFARRHYPNVHHKAIMVPPVVFHQNWVITDREATKTLHRHVHGDVFGDVSRSVYKVNRVDVSLFYPSVFVPVRALSSSPLVHLHS